MLAFGIAHVLYITSMAIRFPGYEMNLLWLALGGNRRRNVSRVCLRNENAVCKFLIPSIAYAFLLCWFVVLSATYVKPAQGSASAGILLAGAILFVLSDMVLSMTYFSKPADYERKGMLNPESRLMIIVNHVTYYLAQFLIALSLLFI